MSQRQPDSDRCILYVTHTSIVSGAEHALLELLRGLPKNTNAHILCPPGELADLLRSERSAVSRVRGTSVSLRLSPMHTLRGGWELLASAVQVRRVAGRSSACLVHANSVRAGLIVVLSSLHGGPLVIVHVHDVMPRGHLTRLIRRLLLKRASALVAVSDYVRRKFLADLPPSTRPFPVLYNPIDVTRFDSGHISREEARRRLGTAPDGPLLGIVAQITPWKGHDTAIEALARLRQTHTGARLAFVGEAKFVGPGTRFDNAAFKARLDQLIADLGLGDAVEFWGQRDDVPAILPALDAILIPSWEEPLGRTMLEAMASGTPVVATARGGPAEVIENGRTGVLVPPRDPEAWAQALSALLNDPDLSASITAAAREVVSARFDRDTYVRDVLALYDGLLRAE